MQFEENHIYHIFNQGNNRQKIFFSRDNYIFFLKKIKSQILPYSDILAWCLMPNHFHLIVYVHKIQRNIYMKAVKHLSGNVSDKDSKVQTFSNSIGILLSSYTRAVNLQVKRSGSLFRKETKAICLTKIDRISKAWFTENGIIRINNPPPEKVYPNICFNYILFNPVKDGLAESPEKWEFSSYKDMVGMRNGTLISRERIKELGLRSQQE